jgi:hypothetical protein
LLLLALAEDEDEAVEVDACVVVVWLVFAFF